MSFPSADSTHAHIDRPVSVFTPSQRVDCLQQMHSHANASNPSFVFVCASCSEDSQHANSLRINKHRVPVAHSTGRHQRFPAAAVPISRRAHTHAVYLRRLPYRGFSLFMTISCARFVRVGLVYYNKFVPFRFCNCWITSAGGFSASMSACRFSISTA